ncbi:sigma-54-dependent transcriptional regulator [Undibacterium flavidum]|uniref:Sigma-54-dependent Fis family transcriptional regulator n=1 Tax=Undibacterium flavidum TaxID=2762297 RepID=A0ABR6Y7E9_9BURK|nr:sigma-54 dependent transcriptional regulator [Undibacterium flavidum]MBC3872092.1 sigma-54-dependent Fis family transcriptional regulator [Undibacterium flavidum]
MIVNTACVLIIDDDSSVQVSLALLLKQAGYHSVTCDGPLQALQVLATQPVDLILQDMNFSLQTSGEEGLQLLTEIKQRHPEIPILLMTAWGSIALAVQGMKLGATDFFTKPWNNAALLQLLQTTLTLAQTTELIKPERQVLDLQYDFSGIIGEHPDLLKVLATIARVAKTNASVLILGESGTGKELIADAIHRNSPRSSRHVVKVNMGAITSSLFESEMFGHVRGAFTDAKNDRKGYFAQAHQSTLFLDEIGELQRADQVKLLRVLQNQTYQAVGGSKTEQADVRIISATNKELAELVANGDFREDLFYRLNLITIRLPALRERRSDIPLLAKRLIKLLTDSYGMSEVQISNAALQWLSQQVWPGNIRQLKQCIERSLLLVDKTLLEVEDLRMAEEVDTQSDLSKSEGLNLSGLTLAQVEKHMIEKAMEEHQGQISRVAKTLGLSRFTLYRRLEKHQIATEGLANLERDSE